MYSLVDGTRGGRTKAAGIALITLVGLLLGACAGAYYAVKTLPLPNETVIYVAR